MRAAYVVCPSEDQTLQLVVDLTVRLEALLKAAAIYFLDGPKRKATQARSR